ncbi:MAG: hypothetical protein HZB56_12795 [Deltaproteobacteria bacterium]|nr:hypothetical protein [Deltaproteobacteria bacterium]
MSRELPQPRPVAPPITFEVGKHRVRVGGQPGTWQVSVDERSLDRTYATAADAWEAGVREADRQDRAV